MNAKILLGEDDRLVRQIVKSYFSQAGSEIRTAENDQEIREVDVMLPYAPDPFIQALRPGTLGTINNFDSSLAAIWKTQHGSQVKYSTSINSPTVPRLETRHRSDRAESHSGRRIWYTKAPSLIQM